MRWLFAFLLSLCVTAQARDLDPSLWSLELRNEAETRHLSDYRGKVIWIDFWASWCSSCRQSFPWMKALQERYRDRDFEILAIDLDSDSAQGKAFVRALGGVPFKVYYDPEGKSAERFGVMGMPSSYLIDRQGRVVMEHVGFRGSQREELERIVKQAVEGGEDE